MFPTTPQKVARAALASKKVSFLAKHRPPDSCLSLAGAPGWPNKKQLSFICLLLV